MLIFAGTGLVFLFSTCKKEHIAPVNQLVKDLFCFKEGSEWTYYDSISQTTTKMIITEYENTKLAAMPKGGRKAYNFAEYIKINGFFCSDFNVTIRAEGEREEYDNTAIFQAYTASDRSSLSFECDKSNNFNCSVAFFVEYNMNNITYRNVYIFEKENTLFYVAQYVGLIRMTKIDNFDWVLVNKNIRQ
jgi:hypothetical protein